MKKALFILFFSLFVAACEDDFVPTNSIANVISQDNSFGFLRIVMVRAGLTEDLNAGILTVFAPDNNAFKASGYPDEASVRAIPTATCEKIMQYHTLSKKNEASFFTVGTNIETTMLNNEKTFISKKDNVISINGAKVVKADIQADNGVMHVIDRVLMPASGNIADVVGNNPDLSFFAAALKRAATINNGISLVTIGTANNTVFAPNNQAFIDLGYKTLASINAASATGLAAILNYHIVAGRQFSSNFVVGDVLTASTSKFKIVAGTPLMVLGNGNAGKAANFLSTDILATNGLVHLIDKVLLP